MITNKNIAISFTSKNHPIKAIHHTSNGDITIREAITAKDKEQLSSFLIDRVFIEEKDYVESAGLNKKEKKNATLDYLLKLNDIDDGNYSFLIAEKLTENETRIVGTASLGNDIWSKYKYYNPNVGLLGNMYILPEYKNMGIGSKMVNLLIDSVKGHYTDVCIFCRDKLVPLYKSLNFKDQSDSHQDRLDFLRDESCFPAKCNFMNFSLENKS